MKSIVFRADASLDIGSGHIMRCLTLADEFKKQDWKSIFICRNLPGNLFEIIRQRGHQLLRLPAPADGVGVPWEEDATQTYDLIKKCEARPEWLIIDHYALDYRWEKKLENSTNKIFVIDDIAAKFHQCNLLLNQNLLPGIEETYRKLLLKDTKLLLGQKYALLTPEYKKAHQRMKTRSGKIGRIFVFYGSGDATNETDKAISALVGLCRPDIHVDVVIGSACSHKNTIEKRVKQLPNATLHTQLPHLADLMSQSDIALSAGGNCIFELLFLGVPTLVTTTADNQVPSIRHLNEVGYLTWLGSSDDVSADQIKEELHKVLNQPEKLHLESQKGWGMIDGQGAEKIAAIMTDFSETSQIDSHTRTSRPLRIGSMSLGLGYRPFIIAEMSGNHNGTLEGALKILNAAQANGADAIKLQTFTPGTLTIDSKRPEFFINDPKSLWHGYRLWDLYAEAHTPWEWHKPIFEAARAMGLACISSAFDFDSLEFLLSLGVDAIKIASFEFVHIPLIEAVARSGKPLILSTGMANLMEIDDAVATIRTNGCDQFILLKCTSAYPSEENEANILTMQDMRLRYGCDVGLSDHTLRSYAAFAATALGAAVIEKHFTIARTEGGVDSAFSIEPSELRELALGTKLIWQSLGNVHYGPLSVEETSLKERPSIYVVRPMKKGEKFTKENIRIIRPANGLAPKYYRSVIGKICACDLDGEVPMSWDLLAQDEKGCKQ